MLIWLNAGLISEDKAFIHTSDRGFTLGDGLFETLAVKQGNILQIEAHLDRLRAGCSLLALPFPTVDLAEVFQSIVKANGCTDAVLRLTLSRGQGPRSLVPPKTVDPTLVITTSAWPDGPEAVRCVIVQQTRRNEFSPLARVKALPYLDNILALQEAMVRGADEALLLNTTGTVVASSRANIFVVKEGHIKSPPVEAGALPGTARALLLRNLSVSESRLTPQDLYEADEVFLTNSLGVRSVYECDGQRVGQHNHTPIAARARDLIFSDDKR